MTALRSFLSHLAAHMRIPLYRNGYALVLSSATTSGLGVVYWVLAARYYSADAVGVNSAAIAAMGLVSGLAQLNLNSMLIRFIPQAGRATERLILYSYVLTIVTSAIFALGFCLGLQMWFPERSFIGSDRGLLLWFVAATVIWSVFTLQDSALTGLRQAVWVPIENTVFAVVKLVLLATFATSLHHYGIFASWTLPVLMALIPMNILIFRSLVPAHARTTGAHTEPPRLQTIVKYVAGNYFGSLFSILANTSLPILVLYAAGATANAHFYLPWTIATSLQLVAMNMTASLTVEGTIEQQKLLSYCRSTVIQTVRMILPVVLVLVIGAPFILSVFGRSYASEGAMLLRLLALSALVDIPIALYIGIARIRNRIAGIIITQATLFFSMIISSYLLLNVYGITGVGIGYLASHMIIALWLTATALRPLLPWRSNATALPEVNTSATSNLR